MKTAIQAITNDYEKDNNDIRHRVDNGRLWNAIH